MKINMASWDRILRLILGTLFFAWAVAGGPWWAHLGLVLIATSAWRFCPFYAVLRTGTQTRE
ncbi:MAG: DUF2892 domain-containing protein [Bdellovibrionota bacterium]